MLHLLRQMAGSENVIKSERICTCDFMVTKPCRWKRFGWYVIEYQGCSCTCTSCSNKNLNCTCVSSANWCSRMYDVSVLSTSRKYQISCRIHSVNGPHSYLLISCFMLFPSHSKPAVCFDYPLVMTVTGLTTHKIL